MQTRSSKFYLFLFIILFLIGLCIPRVIIQAESNWSREGNLVNLYFFHSDTCSHCAEEEKLLKKLEKNYPNLRIYRYEIHEEETNSILKTAQSIYNMKTDGVPITIIGEEVYFGYAERSSKLKFIKTIEYYSQYAYQDRLGESLGLIDLPFYQAKENDKTLEEFLEEYGNYHLIGNLETKDLEEESAAMIAGALFGIQPIFILGLIFCFLYLKKRIRNQKEQLLLIGFYFLAHFFFTSTMVFQEKFYTLGIQILFLLVFTGSLMKYYKNKRRQYAALNLFTIIAIIVHFFMREYQTKYLEVFFNMKKIYLLEGFGVVSYYANYFISFFLVQFLISLFIIMLIHKIPQKQV